MLARFTGAALGLLAFTITVTAGFFTGNPITTTLSRSILALFSFCFLGLVLGAAAQAVVTDYVARRESKIREKYPRVSASGDRESSQDGEIVDGDVTAA
jgi:hypothetical protein